MRNKKGSVLIAAVLLTALFLSQGCVVTRTGEASAAAVSVCPAATAPPATLLNAATTTPQAPGASAVPAPLTARDARPLQVQVFYAGRYFLKMTISPMTDSNGALHPVGGKIDVSVWRQTDFVSAAATAPLQHWQSVALPALLYGTPVELEYNDYQTSVLNQPGVLEVVLTADDGSVWYSLQMDVPLWTDL